MTPVQTVQVVRVAAFPLLRIFALLLLGAYVLWTYWIVPKIDSMTPWEGVAPSKPWDGAVPNPGMPNIPGTPWPLIPDAPWDGIIPGSYGCPTAPVPPPVQPASGFPALLHDIGAGVRSLASGPPSADAIKAWFGETGESSAMALHFVKGGLDGKPKPLGLAPEVPPAAPLAVAAPGLLSEAQVASLAVQAGWPAAELPNVVARVMAESTGNPRATDYADGTHHGLLQLGAAERQRYIPGGDAFDPLTNLRGGLALWQERGWQPWAASDSAVAARPVSACDPGAMLAGASGPMVPVANGQSLRADVAPAYSAMAAAFQASFGKPLILTSGYRSTEQQARLYNEHRARGSNLAAPPGKSNHEKGIAVDLGSGVNSFGTPEHRWMQANAGHFGFHHPGWAQRSGSKPEAWHWEYIGTGTPAG